MKKVYILLILIILLGSFLRFFQLGDESFWADEGATGMTIKKYTAMQILDNVKKYGQFLPGYYYSDDDLPLYYMLLKGWTRIFGISDYSLRSFSAFFGSMALIAVFYLSRLLFDEKTALLTTFLSSVSLILIWYAQDARQYSYLFFLSLASVIFLLKSLKEKKTIYVVLFIITNTFIIFTHFTWVMFFIFEGLYALYFMYKEHSLKKEVNMKIIVAFLIIALLYSTIIGRAFTSQTDTIRNYGRPDLDQIARFGIQLSTWIYPTEPMAQKIYAFSFDFSFSEWILFLSVLFFSLILSILFIFGIYISLKRNYKKESTTFLLFMFFVPLIFALVLSYIHPIVTVFQIKQLIYIIPPFLVLASVGCLRLKNRIVLISLLGLLIIPQIYAYYSNVDREQFKEAADFLPKDELIMIHTKTTQAVFKYYYGEKPNAIGVANLEEVKQHIKDKDNFWFLFTFLRYSQHGEEIKEFLDQNYRIIETKHFFGIDLINYEKN